MHVLGASERTLAGRLGRFRAPDGSAGAPVGIDFARPHAVAVVGKRGSGKSNTLGVIARELLAAEGVAPVVCDPMGAFAAVGRRVEPVIRASALAPPAWCDLLGLAPESGAGALVWQAAAARDTLAGMRSFVEENDAPGRTRRAATNHLDLAASWGVFSPDGTGSDALCGATLDLTGLDPAPMNAVVRVVAATLYDARLHGDLGVIPWLILDEAHVAFGGAAAPALHRILTRGRAPGVSFVAATQRPAALPQVAVSQADLLVSHRLSGRGDRETLVSARPALAGYDRWPCEPGAALVVDDASETVHAVRVRACPEHGGQTATVPKEASSSAK
jgi:DNA helicase HerA-like ATPase